MLRIGLILLVLGVLSGAMSGCHAEGDVSGSEGHASSFIR
jgi:hypothetical protein